jgi:hypothetical protein
MEVELNTAMIQAAYHRRADILRASNESRAIYGKPPSCDVAAANIAAYAFWHTYAKSKADFLNLLYCTALHLFS